MKRTAAALFLLAIVVLLYRKVTRLWWTYDDAWILHIGLVRPWTDAFTQADVWPQKLFTPLLTATYEALMQLAGLHPARWYRVDLVLLGACGVALFAALRFYVRTIPSLAGALLFVAGPPLCSFATQLMTVHYLEAILLGTLSVIAFVGAFRRMSVPLNLLSALLYFFAMLAKEIAIPLPVLLVCLPERALSVRARHLSLHGLAFAAYFVWRWRILGTLFGGYGWAIAPSELPAVIVELPWKVIAACAGAGTAVGFLLVALAALGAAAALRTRHAWIAAALTFVVAIAPILPVSKEMQSRYALVPWLWLSVAFAIGVARWRSGARETLIVAACAAAIVANRQEWTATYAHAKRMSDEARAFFSMDGNAVLHAPAIPAGSMAEYQWLKEEHFRRGRGTSWYYDDFYLCGAALDGKHIYEYVPERREVVEVTARIPDHARAWCGSIRKDAPLRAEFHHRGESLFWKFGPYARGRWSVLLGNGVQAFEVPREDGFRLAGVPRLALRIRYDAPEGWVTYSPEIALDFARQPDLTWHR